MVTGKREKSQKTYDNTAFVTEDDFDEDEGAWAFVEDLRGRPQ